ncbi:MAG: D-glycero-beta-D-manno-heptose 1,7-bisphosphate 7-phosphatase [bacterium]
MNRAVFVDRDGTLCPDVPYLDEKEKLELFPETPGAIRRLKGAGFRIVVVTNQSGVGRGYFTLDALAAVHERLRYLLKEAGADVDALYYCPHAPDDGCDCRKPKTGMIDGAAAELSISLDKSYLVGDDTVDVQLARNAGLKAILVLTGHGKKSEPSVRADAVVRNLEEAADWILKDAGKNE